MKGVEKMALYERRDSGALLCKLLMIEILFTLEVDQHDQYSRLSAGIISKRAMTIILTQAPQGTVGGGP